MTEPLSLYDNASLTYKVVRDKDGQERAVLVVEDRGTPPQREKTWNEILFPIDQPRWVWAAKVYLFPLLVGLGMIWLLLETHHKGLTDRSSGETP